MKRIQTNLRAILDFCNRHTSLIFMGCLLLAAGLRIWGLNYGLPFIYHPDESLPVDKAQMMLKTGDFNPHFFHWPSLIFYINTVAYGLHYLIGKLFGIFHMVGDIPGPIVLAMGTGRMPMTSIWLLSRAITMGFGLGVVILAFFSAKEVTGKTAVGLLASLLIAISPTNVLHSRYIAPDMLATFFIMLAFYGSAKVWKDGRCRYYVLTGIAVGLATSSKYNAVLILSTFLLAHFMHYGLKGIKKGDFYVTLFLSGATFLATMPYAVLDFPTFWTDIQFDRHHYATGHPGMEGDTLNWYLSFLWRIEGIGFILAAIEVIRGIFTRSKSILFMALFPTVYFIFINGFVVRNDRTLLPMLPFMMLLAANLLVWIFEKLAERQNTKTTVEFTIGVFVILFVLIGLPLQRTVRSNIKLTTIDSRETARVWIEEHLPPGSKIAIESYAPYIEPSQFSVTGIYGLKDNTISWYEENGFDYLVFSQGSYGRFFREPERYAKEMTEYEELWRQLDLEKIFNDGGYEVRIYTIDK